MLSFVYLCVLVCQGAIQMANWGCGAFGQAGVLSLNNADQLHLTGKHTKASTQANHSPPLHLTLLSKTPCDDMCPSCADGAG